jgi:hypothetical protein
MLTPITHILHRKELRNLNKVMTCKNFIILLFLFITTSLFAQESVDFKKIEKEINNIESPFYYNRIFERYTKNDTTLTMYEYWYLYYGYSFQEQYSPYSWNAYDDSLKYYFNLKEISTSDFENMKALTRKIINDDPFNTRVMYLQSFACYNLKDTVESKKWIKKYNSIIETILSSGDGKTEESAMAVIYIRDEYEVLNALGLHFNGQQSLTQSKCDYLQVDKNDYNLNGLYFNVNRLFEVGIK